MARKLKLDNALLKRQKQKEKKRIQTKKIRCRILIVCEGEKTEPQYFKAFKTINNQSFTYEVDARGTGYNTLSLVNEAIRLRESASTPYDSVWAVFDRDIFTEATFNQAINVAIKSNINVAWSNEAFELWYLYHFHNRVTPMTRNEYKLKIEEAVNNSPSYKKKKKFVYEKNNRENYHIMTTYGKQGNAINWARAQHLSYTDSRYSKQNPCTTVYQLVLQLLNRDDKLISRVMAKINAT